MKSVVSQGWQLTEAENIVTENNGCCFKYDTNRIENSSSTPLVVSTSNNVKVVLQKVGGTSTELANFGVLTATLCMVATTWLQARCLYINNRKKTAVHPGSPI